MAKSRLELQALLEELLGSRNVYYQPPESVKMRYPAIVYERSKIEQRHANDSTYIQSRVYELTVIDDDPESEIVEKVALLPMCRYDRQFVSDNLYHDTFTIYF